MRPRLPRRPRPQRLRQRRPSAMRTCSSSVPASRDCAPPRCSLRTGAASLCSRRAIASVAASTRIDPGAFPWSSVRLGSTGSRTIRLLRWPRRRESQRRPPTTSPPCMALMVSDLATMRSTISRNRWPSWLRQAAQAPPIPTNRFRPRSTAPSPPQILTPLSYSTSRWASPSRSSTSTPPTPSICQR